MGRGLPGTRCHHGLWVSSDYPLRELSRGRSGAGHLPFPTHLHDPYNCGKVQGPDSSLTLCPTHLPRCLPASNLPSELDFWATWFETNTYTLRNFCSGGGGGRANVILFDQTKDPIYKLNEGFRWERCWEFFFCPGHEVLVNANCVTLFSLDRCRPCSISENQPMGLSLICSRFFLATLVVAAMTFYVLQGYF